VQRIQGHLRVAQIRPGAFAVAEAAEFHVLIAFDAQFIGHAGDPVGPLQRAEIIEGLLHRARDIAFLRFGQRADGDGGVVAGQHILVDSAAVHLVGQELVVAFVQEWLSASYLHHRR
jgi:hypothetical protein